MTPGIAGTMRPLWSVTAPPAHEYPALEEAVRAQLVIVGAGYTGLSAALHAASRGLDTVLLESTDVGQRASGLNGGQVIAGVKDDPAQLLERFGPEFGQRVIDTVGRGPDLVFELIERHSIECDAVRKGWIQAAVTDQGLRILQSRAAQWRQHGVAAVPLDRESTATLIGTAYYRGGWLDPRGGTVQPLGYARGLARAASQAGARIHTHTPALRLQRAGTGAGAGWRIDTPRGRVLADRVILATDAYTDALFEPLRRTVVPVPSFQVATAPLPLELRARILPGGQSVSDTGQLLRYFRLDAHGRLLMGSRGAFDRTPTPATTQHLYQAVREMFRPLIDVPFEYHWSGFVAITADRLPHLHEPAPGLLAGLGYNGRGVAMATVMGRLLAHLAAGTPHEEIGFPVTAVRPMRLHRFARLGARATLQILKARDGLERRRLRTG